MNIIILAGSNRKVATSTKLCEYIQHMIMEHGVKANLFDLFVQPVPMYSPDEEIEDDANLIDLKQKMKAADGIVLATPEYHGTMTGVLKNALDHLSGEHFEGKPVLSVCSSGGAVGVSTLLQLQAVARNMHGINCPEWISIGGDGRKFTESGEPQLEKVRQRVIKAVLTFIEMTQRLRMTS